MSLSNLIKKGGLAKVATVTPATIATQEAEQAVTVAPVTTVAVAEKPEPLSELSPDKEASIRAWLALIGETDPDIITEVINQCRNESDARQYFLKRSEEVPQAVRINELITCSNCTSYKRIEHPHLGHCTKGEPEAIAGLWDSDRHYCEQFITGTKQSTGIQTDTRKDKHEIKIP